MGRHSPALHGVLGGVDVGLGSGVDFFRAASALCAPGRWGICRWICFDTKIKGLTRFLTRFWGLRVEICCEAALDEVMSGKRRDSFVGAEARKHGVLEARRLLRDGLSRGTRLLST